MIMLKIAAAVVGGVTAGALVVTFAPRFCSDVALAVVACFSSPLETRRPRNRRVTSLTALAFAGPKLRALSITISAHSSVWTEGAVEAAVVGALGRAGAAA
jgi:hypothetical protein